jgi:hypothetical protein
MLRFLPLLVLAGACGNDKPTLILSVDDKAMLSITLQRGDDHVFGKVHATANGIDCGPAEIQKGSEGITWSEASSGATASWKIDMASLGEAVHVVVTEDGETFSVDAPAVGATRTPQLLTSLAAPIAPGDWFEATDGVPSDRVSGGFEITLADGSSCTVQWSTQLEPGTVSLLLAKPENLQTDWWCGDYPAPGTVVKASLSLDLWIAATVTNCKGDDLTCPDVDVPDLNITTPVEIRF